VSETSVGEVPPYPPSESRGLDSLEDWWRDARLSYGFDLHRLRDVPCRFRRVTGIMEKKLRAIKECVDNDREYDTMSSGAVHEVKEKADTGKSR
jgi:hypothetical protein